MKYSLLLVALLSASSMIAKEVAAPNVEEVTDIKVTVVDSSLIISVKDSGIGISQENIPKVF